MILGTSVSAIAQDKITSLEFDLEFNDLPFQLDKTYYASELKDSFKINTLKFYISRIKADKLHTKMADSDNGHYLIDFSDESSLTIETDLVYPSDGVLFELGVDSLINAGGAQGGDLDPVNGMYWSWQSGYVNFKLEGESKICDTRKNQFVYHLGGFLFPYQSITTVFVSPNQKGAMQINLNLNKVLEVIDLKGLPNLMSPGEESVRLSDGISNCFESK